MSEWNLLDYTVLACLLVPLTMGLFRGLIRVVFGLVGVLAGLGLAIPFSRPLGNIISTLLGMESYFPGRVTAFVIIYGGCWILAISIAFALKSTLAKLKLR